MKWTNKISKSFWFQFVPAMILGPLTVALLIFGFIPLQYLLATFVMWILVCGLGIAVGYHRVFSHKTHALPDWKEIIILFFATFAGQGASIFWTAMHRGYHHRHTDTLKDFHSPVAYNKLSAFVGWHFKLTSENSTVNMKYAVDLLKKKHHVWFHNHYYKVYWGVPIVVAMFNWHLALTAFCLVTFIGLLQDNLINVFGHIKGYIGYRNFNTKDNSHNNFILGYLTWGQGWHNNHHANPGNFDFGSGTSGKWWELDLAKIFIPFLK